MGHIAKSDAELVEASRRGEREAFGTLVTRYQDVVCAVSFSSTGNWATSQDVAQDTCLGVLRAIPGWQELGRPLWAFVFAIARNKIADRARSHAARRDVLVGHDSYPDVVIDPRRGPTELIEDDEGAGRVLAMMEALPATQREVLLLRVIVGLSTAETAAALSLTVGSVRVLQHRAVTALRTRFTAGGTA